MLISEHLESPEHYVDILPTYLLYSNRSSLSPRPSLPLCDLLHSILLCLIDLYCPLDSLDHLNLKLLCPVDHLHLLSPPNQLQIIVYWGGGNMSGVLEDL